ncbi:TonB-dependent receptor plug domain-containing protein [Bowmanella dokdonensis]|uniref:TonB-dependent receptor n=1 Tax=Bowmanella dokdonensis TaxID=751969 RepID=A0A939DKW6_9ALTE|nr:TonB-dependent receptor [Bowmanella dokdonensis]MBN7823746.1 TonB-dependent receptor [Bowmanella dokdonensis]
MKTEIGSSKKSRLLILLLLACHFCHPLMAEEMAELEEMAQFMAMLEEETELATHSKMNADYVPGMVSVLHGDDLTERGVQNVAAALNQIAGFYSIVNNSGDIVNIVRGVGASVNGSNLKILVDGVAVNRPVDASADWVMRLPITQVERIEVVRGPGSALYGEFAFSGVVNVITRRQNSLLVKAGDQDYRQSDLLLNHNWESGLSASLNLSAWDQNDSGRKTNPDNFAQSGHGHSPGNIYDREKGRLLLAQGEYQGYQLILQYAELERGGWYGRNAAMPFSLEPGLETAQGIELNKRWSVGRGFELGMNISSLQTRLDHATFLPIPAGITGPGGRPILEDRYVREGSEDSTQKLGLDLHWQASTHHHLYAQLAYGVNQVDSSFLNTYVPGQPVISGPEERVLVMAGVKRRLTSLTIQDQWQASDRLEITFGARHDHYDDWGRRTTPRLAAVWRLSDNHILKAQYAEAFRPPTLKETYPGSQSIVARPGSDLVEEELTSSELAYIYRAPGLSFRSTLFHTKVSDLIEYFQRPGQRPLWRNHGELDTQGLELEWQQDINRNWQWLANLSYVDAEDRLEQGEGELLGAVNWLGNLGITWRSDAYATHQLWLRHVGQQEGWDITLRTPVTREFDAHTTLDYSLTMDKLFNQDGLSLTASINNLTNKEYDIVPNPLQYPQGLPFGGRRAYVQLQYQF